MKVKTLSTLLVSFLLMITGCEKPCADCGWGAFVEGYSAYIQKEEVFFIKGIALDVYEHGRNIKVIEDLKGNIANKSSIFVWGAYITSRCTESVRQDFITQYNKNDTLIMILEKTKRKYARDIERRGDYAIIPCALPVLVLSNGYVTGHIYPYDYEEGAPYWKETTMLWTELQEELQKLLNPKTKS